MLISLDRRRRGQSGQQGLWITLLLLMAGIVTSMSYFLNLSVKSTGRKIVANRSYLRNSSTAETALVAYRLAEVKYLSALSTCNSARPFMEALKLGTGCPTGVKVFDSADPSDPGVIDGLYTFTGPGCRLTQTASSCAGQRTELLSGSLDTLLTGAYEAAPAPVRAGIFGSIFGRLFTRGAEGAGPSGFAMFIDTIQPQKGIIEMSTEVTQGATKNKFAFAIRSPLANSAHLEADGRVTQNSPDPLALCPGTIWADLLLFNPATRRCENYAQLGGGTGLALYRDRFFGLRPGDGQIVDLNAMTQGASYLVTPSTGSTGTMPPVFVPYNQSLLVNVDDITLIDDQIYYVANLGANPEIGLLDMSAGGNRLKICNLGAMGWSQSYEGIGAHGSSVRSFPPRTTACLRRAFASPRFT